MLHRYHILRTVILCSQLIACTNPLSFSPFDTQLASNERNLTQLNLLKLSPAQPSSFTPFKIATISDTHTFYDDLKDAVNHINLLSNIDFVMIAGDLTDMGLIQEYRWTHERLKALQTPFITAIGNHDTLANGTEIYRDMFGSLDYSFVYKNVKFIVLNSNSWEFDNTVPNLEWLRRQKETEVSYQHTLVLTHIGPYDERFVGNIETAFSQAINDLDVSLYIHGHHHNFSYATNYYNDGVDYLIVGSVSRRTYTTIQIDADAITIEVIPF